MKQPKYVITYRYNGKLVTIPCNSMKEAWKEMVRLLKLRDDKSINANIKPSMHQI